MFEKKCKYCKVIIKKLKKNSVTCGKNFCIKSYRNEYAKRDSVKEYNKKYQIITNKALWVLAKKHKKEFREIRDKLK